ncbi:hypothetical protein NDU88_002598 [Pleurodeles waltl]|uniref:Uncharacterized protein n=1 Tax=Pleurodeles waltl TaxID=8319 RepID=A0AAV7M3U3_PLEWA|nr:hypothetical protein NDU88_002598 [Pleurodeles waltl]
MRRAPDSRRKLQAEDPAAQFHSKKEATGIGRPAVNQHSRKRSKQLRTRFLKYSDRRRRPNRNKHAKAPKDRWVQGWWQRLWNTGPSSPVLSSGGT